MGTGTKVRGNEVWEEPVILTQNRQLILPVFRKDPSSGKKKVICQLAYIFALIFLLLPCTAVALYYSDRKQMSLSKPKPVI